MELDELFNKVDFLEFAEMYMQTREAEWEHGGLDVRHLVKGDGTPASELQAKHQSEFAYHVLKDSTNLSLLMLQNYHTWLLTKLAEIIP